MLVIGEATLRKFESVSEIFKCKDYLDSNSVRLFFQGLLQHFQ